MGGLFGGSPDTSGAERAAAETRAENEKIRRKLKKKSDSSQSKTQLVLKQEFVVVAVCCYPIHV